MGLSGWGKFLFLAYTPLYSKIVALVRFIVRKPMTYRKDKIYLGAVVD